MLLEFSKLKQEGVCLREKFWYNPYNVGVYPLSSVYKTDFVSDTRIDALFLIIYPFLFIKE